MSNNEAEWNFETPFSLPMSSWVNMARATQELLRNSLSHSQRGSHEPDCAKGNIRAHLLHKQQWQSSPGFLTQLQKLHCVKGSFMVGA